MQNCFAMLKRLNSNNKHSFKSFNKFESIGNQIKTSNEIYAHNTYAYLNEQSKNKNQIMISAQTIANSKQK